MSKHVVVWLQEEYGYRYWRWEPGMTGDELIQWWTQLETVSPYFFSPVGLPGKLTQLGEEDIENLYEHSRENMWRAHIHEDEDSYLLPPGGKYVYHAGAKDYE